MLERLRHLGSELKRRHVYRVAVSYVVVGLGVLGAAELVLDPLGLGGARPFVVVLTLLGFPIALMLAWALELTPEGVRVSAPLEPAGIPDDKPPPNRSQTKQAVAVLPLKNIGGDPENEFFVDGLTEDLIAQVSRISKLRVISRTSVVRFKDSSESLGDIASALGADTILEGSARRSGSRVRIVVQLIDAASDEHLWAETYDRELEDVFAIQSEIALQVAQVLRTALSPGERERISRPPTESLGAYDFYLLGQNYWHRFSPDGIQKAREYYGRALELDPMFAPAHEGLANLYLQIGGAGLNLLPPADALPRAKEAAERAIALDPHNGSAHGCLALVACWFEWAWDAAVARGQIGVGADPNSANAWRCYAHALDALGRFDECLAAIENALKLDPLAPVSLHNAASHYWHAGDAERATEVCDRVIHLEPEFFWGHLVKAEILLDTGDAKDAVSLLEPVRPVLGQSDYGSSVLGNALARSGRHEEALAIAVDLENRVKRGMTSWSEVSLVYLGLGERERALECLERVPNNRPPGGLYTTPYLAVRPSFDALRGEPRFQRVLAQLGLPTAD